MGEGRRGLFFFLSFIKGILNSRKFIQESLMACISQEFRIDDGDDDNNNRELTSILSGSPTLFNPQVYCHWFDFIVAFDYIKNSFTTPNLQVK